MLRYYVVVAGRVQGVGFRFFCQSHASIMNITGFVRNMSNGMVELQIQGSEEVLDKFLSLIKSGNRFIRVDDISIKKIPLLQEEKGFKVVY